MKTDIIILHGENPRDVSERFQEWRKTRNEIQREVEIITASLTYNPKPPEVVLEYSCYLTVVFLELNERS